MTDSNQMQRIKRSFPGQFKSILLELTEKPMSRHEIRDFLNRMARVDRSGNVTKAQLRLEKDLDTALAMQILEEKDGKYYLTPAGNEAAGQIQQKIPIFFNQVFAPETVALFSIVIHVVLSLLKLGVGLLSGSAGLFADGIDNTVDTLSSLLVWLGIKFDKEKLVSVFILVTMFLSVGGIALATIDKALHMEPVKEGVTAFSVSFVCGLVMLGLSSYQYTVGKRASSLAIMCQSVDSRNHFWTSLLVCGGILFSFFAEVFGFDWLHYADVLASALICLLVLKGAVELAEALYKEDQEEADVSHFMKTLQERNQKTILFKWLSAQLHSQALTQKELEQKFAGDFCRQTPKILKMTEIGYRPESGTDLHSYLNGFVEQKKLIRDNGRYWLIV